MYKPKNFKPSNLDKYNRRLNLAMVTFASSVIIFIVSLFLLIYISFIYFLLILIAVLFFLIGVYHWVHIAELIKHLLHTFESSQLFKWETTSKDVNLKTISELFTFYKVNSELFLKLTKIYNKASFEFIIVLFDKSKTPIWDKRMRMAQYLDLGYMSLGQKKYEDAYNIFKSFTKEAKINTKSFIKDVKRKGIFSSPSPYNLAYDRIYRSEVNQRIRELEEKI